MLIWSYIFAKPKIIGGFTGVYVDDKDSGGSSGGGGYGGGGEPPPIEKPTLKAGLYSYGGLYGGGGVSQEDKEENEPSEEVGTNVTPGQAQST